VNAAGAIGQNMIENIRIAQDPYENPDHTGLVKAMAEAERVFFLGFGYDNENLKKLGLSEIRSHATIYGTAYGLRREEIRRAKSRISRHLISHDGEPVPGVELSGEEDDCMLLLRDHLP